MAAPPVVVAQAESQGLVAPTTVVDLPQVPLNVPPSPGRPLRLQHLRHPRPAATAAVSPEVLIKRRSRAMRLVLVIVFIALVARLVGVQELSHQHYAALSTSELSQTVTVPAVRGGLYDRNGEVLAETVTRQTVVGDPLLITRPAPIADALSPVLGVSTDHPAVRADREQRLRLPGPPGVRRRGRQVKVTSPAWHQPHPRDPAGRPGRTPRPAAGGYRRLGRERPLGPRVPVPVAPGRKGREEEPAPGARRRRPPGDHRQLRYRRDPGPASSSPSTSRCSTSPSRPSAPRSPPPTPTAAPRW